MGNRQKAKARTPEQKDRRETGISEGGLITMYSEDIEVLRDNGQGELVVTFWNTALLTAQQIEKASKEGNLSTYKRSQPYYQGVDGYLIGKSLIWPRTALFEVLGWLQRHQLAYTTSDTSDNPNNAA